MLFRSLSAYLKAHTDKYLNLVFDNVLKLPMCYLKLFEFIIICSLQSISRCNLPFVFRSLSLVNGLQIEHLKWVAVLNSEYISIK